MDLMLVDFTVQGVTKREDIVSNKLIQEHNVSDQCPKTRLLLQDCTNIIEVVRELSVKDQKKGTKGQWKRRGRMQYLENKEVELKEVEGVSMARKKMESSEQEDNFDCTLATQRILEIL